MLRGTQFLRIEVRPESIGIIKLHEDKLDVIRYLHLMKHLLLLCCLLPNILSAQTAQEILQQVQLRLPQQSITFNGTLKRKTANGFNRVSLPIQTTLRLGDTPAYAHYRIGEITLELHWENNQPIYTFSDKTLDPTHEIADSGMSWTDLSLGFLWWPNPTLIGPTRKINRDAWLLEIPVPNHTDHLRVWIEKEMAMLLEVKRINAKGRRLQTLRIKRLQKIDEFWFAKQIELFHHRNGERSIIYVNETIRL